MARIVEIPVAMQQPPLLCHALIQCSGGIRGEYVKGGRFNALLNRPGDGTVKDRFVIVGHAKNEAPVDHDSKVVEAPDGRTVVTIEILILVLLLQIGSAERLKSDE